MNHAQAVCQLMQGGGHRNMRANGNGNHLSKKQCAGKGKQHVHGIAAPPHYYQLQGNEKDAEHQIQISILQVLQLFKKKQLLSDLARVLWRIRM